MYLPEGHGAWLIRRTSREPPRAAPNRIGRIRQKVRDVLGDTNVTRVIRTSNVLHVRADQVCYGDRGAAPKAPTARLERSLIGTSFLRGGRPQQGHGRTRKPARGRGGDGDSLLPQDEKRKGNEFLLEAKADDPMDRREQ
jgi:hypothetical protein